MSTEIFDLSEAAEAVGMPLSRAKNWAFGRPLTIKASVRVSRKPGSPSLYNREDLYWLALANQIFEAGVGAKITQELLDIKEGTRLGSLKTPFWLLVSRNGTRHLTEYAQAALLKNLHADLEKLATKDFSVFLLVDVGALVRSVDRRILKYHRKHK